MTRQFKFSLVANFVLAGLLVWSLCAHREKIETVRVVQAGPAPAPHLQPAPAGPPFRWSRLESTNYRTYIANLRSIECPEQTIRDIIAADVDEAYFIALREQLKQNSPALINLQREEATLIASLLNDQPPPFRTIADSQPFPKPLRINSQAGRASDRPVATPLILQPTDLTALNLNPAQAETINELRQNFLSEIGTNQDPNDPAYRQRWQAAQREADDMLVGLLGRKFVLNLEAQLEKSSAPSQ